MTAEEILKKLANKVYQPIYVLMGEEAYFIDQISDYIESNILTESEKEFNLTIVYGKDVDVQTIISHARRFPMMANYQVVIVKEAQHIKNIEELQIYVEKPVKSTILVICYKYGKLDKRKTFAKVIEKHGVLYETPKIWENQVATWITDYLKERKYAIQPKAAQMLAEYLGTNLSNIVNEIGKLLINIPRGTEITPHDVEQNIGISKDYNVFELSNALFAKDVIKANRIALYFARNEKEYPIQMVIPMLYPSFIKLLMYYYIKDKNTNNVAATLSLKPNLVHDYVKAASLYPPRKLVDIISLLHVYDLKSKGVDNSTADSGDLLKELLYKILN